MWKYIIRRISYMIPTLVIISIISFIIIQLPPGDFVTSYAVSLAASGEEVDEALLEGLRQRYGLDKPMYIQYLKWVWGILHGDFGMSFDWNRPVRDLLGERLLLTMVVSLASLIFAWVVALVVGIYSAVRQYSLFDYIFSFLGFLGLSIPNFMLALILMYISTRYLGTGVGGLFSPEYLDAPWSVAKVVDLLKHLWVPVIVVGTAGTAGLIRTMRANLLDELRKPYVETGRSKGLSERVLILRYPVRVAINPLISNLGFVFPQIISGETITSVVLGLPTTGPLFLRALLSQDMYLAGSFILMLAVMTMIGVLVSDILLAWSDPRIRYD
jgi:peptide/nickel transport system permease protein